MKSRRPASLVFAALLVTSAAFGVLRVDESFAGGAASVYDRNAAASGVAIQSDGKVVTVGTSYDSTRGVVLARFTTSGALDPSFGNGGLVDLLPPPPNDFFGNAVAIDSAGRIVVAGSASGATVRVLVARFLPDGSPDASFGTGGLVLTDFPGGGATAEALAIQSDGKIVAAGGFESTGNAYDFAAARFQPDGGLDPSFGVGGRVTVDFGGFIFEYASAVAVRSDGRVVLGGRTDGGSFLYAMALAQLLSDGTPDPGFGTGGKVVISAPQSSECRGLALQSDGRIVVAGPSYPQDGSLVVRLLSNGSLDPAFGTGGVAQIATVGANAVAVDGAGRIAVGGDALGSMALTRLLPSGALDPAVGPDGYVHALGGAPPQIAAGAFALALQRDGRILLGGFNEAVTIQLLTVVRFADGLTAPIPTLSGIGLAILGIGLTLTALLLLRSR